MSDRPAVSVASTIGNVTTAFGLTHRAVRFYEQRGMVSSRRDSTNYRVFDETARRRLQLIALLRRTDLSLVDIQEVLESGDRLEQIEFAVRKLALHKGRLLALVREVERSIERLQQDAPSASPVPAAE